VTFTRRPLSWRGWCVVAVFCATVSAWLLEPWHGVPAALTAIAMAGVLFGTRLLDAGDLKRVGWDTLLLIAGGLTLGHIFDESGLAAATSAAVNWQALSPSIVILSLVTICALISAVSSNTAASVILISIATGISDSPALAVLVAMGASMGAPFVISTPPNALVYGQGILRPRDFLVSGSILMIGGCALLAFTGARVLHWMGIP
jgi:sodium-dependent dicarboxylate transporter 2/3/5